MIDFNLDDVQRLIDTYKEGTGKEPKCIVLSAEQWETLRKEVNSMCVFQDPSGVLSRVGVYTTAVCYVTGIPIYVRP